MGVPLSTGLRYVRPDIPGQKVPMLSILAHRLLREHFTFPLPPPILQAEYGELCKDKKIEEYGQAGTGEPRSIRDKVPWFRRAEQNGEDIRDV